MMATKKTTGECGLVPFPEDWPARPSDQLAGLYRSDPTYRALCGAMRTLLQAGATAHAFSQDPRFAHLAKWHGNRKQSFARVSMWGKQSPELNVWPGMCWHLGPRPHNALSVHRVNDNKPYVLGNLEWATAKRQATEKRGNRKMLWQGKRIADWELVDKLKAIGIHITENTIKQYRKNHKKNHANLDVLHVAMFKKWNVPLSAYDTSAADHIAAEPLMEGLGIDWEKLKKNKPWMSNIGFQLEWVAEKIEEGLKRLNFHKKDGYTEPLERQVMRLQNFQKGLQTRYANLMTQGTADYLKALKPAPLYTMHVTGFDSPPAIEEEEEEEKEEPAKIIPTPIADLAPRLKGEELAAHLKLFE